MKKRFIEEFNFCIGDDYEQYIKYGVQGHVVTIPHTWNVEEDNQLYVGKAWYSTRFNIEELTFRTELKFRAVYRDCSVYVNGKKAGEHNNSGYTPFIVDITDYIKNGENLLVVSCDNSYSANALPFEKAFDWANDGGIIRPVEIVEYTENCTRQARFSSVITNFKDGGRCDAVVSCNLDMLVDTNINASLDIVCLSDNVSVCKCDIKSKSLSFTLNDALLWDTDNPNLYEAVLTFGTTKQSYKFGLRELKTVNDKIYLNDKNIRILAVEWMPGSNPKYGMAEPREELIKFLSMLKDMNCNFTRFHWQQDEWVYDWCDENGLMVQEEIPYWGKPSKAGKVQLECAKKQADDMLYFNYNHPSIVCWGVGNELGGWINNTINFVKNTVQYFKERDNMRLVNYVSSSFGHPNLLAKIGIKKEATYYGDICMWNEYLGTWHAVVSYDDVYKRAIRHSNGKPIVITEFGLCEPFFKGGDPRRIKIYQQKIDYYRHYGFAGWVYFCLNDYRTHVGETGEGRLRQRIHGSTDLIGDKKPSYEFIKNNNGKDKI